MLLSGDDNYLACMLLLQKCVKFHRVQQKYTAEDRQHRQWRSAYISFHLTGASQSLNAVLHCSGIRFLSLRVMSCVQILVLLRTFIPCQLIIDLNKSF